MAMECEYRYTRMAFWLVLTVLVAPASWYWSTMRTGSWRGSWSTSCRTETKSSSSRLCMVVEGDFGQAPFKLR